MDTPAAHGAGRPHGDGALGQAQLNWTAATDNIGVARYNVHRGDERRLHALGREPDRAAHRDELHRHRR